MARPDPATHVPPSARRAAFFAALAFVLYFSLCPSETVDETFSKPVQSYDWLFHSATYAALGALAVLAFLRRPPPPPPRPPPPPPPPPRPPPPPPPRPPPRLLPRLRVTLLLSCLGCLLELGQRLLPFVGRSCSLSDALHNAFGAALGAFLTPALLLLPRTSP